MDVRELFYEELEEASQLLWASFYQTEKNHTSMEGMELFRDLTSPISLSMNTYQENTLLVGTFCEAKLIGVGAISDRYRILLLYVHPEYQNQGVGGALLSYMEASCSEEFVVLNASTSAVPFYMKRGYAPTGHEQEDKGIIFTPMRKEVVR